MPNAKIACRWVGVQSRFGQFSKDWTAMLPILITILISLGTFCMSRNAYADITVEQYQRHMSSDGGKPVILSYICGLLDGYLWMNLAVKLKRGERPFYCQPTKLSITPEQAVSMLDEYLKTHKRQVNYSYSIGPYLLNTLMEIFPCNPP
jgi:hypothetical protein